jgi:hypothetical protein
MSSPVYGIQIPKDAKEGHHLTRSPFVRSACPNFQVRDLSRNGLTTQIENKGAVPSSDGTPVPQQRAYRKLSSQAT